MLIVSFVTFCHYTYLRIGSESKEKLVLNICESQVSAMNSKPDERSAAISSADMGLFDYFDNLPLEILDHIWSNVRHFIP